MRPNKDARDIAREYFPDVSVSGLEYIIWEHTGYPRAFNSLTSNQ